MKVLVTGGTGKTGRRVAGQLARRGVPYRIAARHHDPAHECVRFDWRDRATWAAAIDGVIATYLVPPPGGEASGMIDFIRFAQESGCRRFVLLSASLLPAGGPGAGQIHLWLKANAAEWTVLRPSWFMENFSEAAHQHTIQEQDCIYSAAEDGRVGFISADDIAASACAALVRSSAFNGDFVLTGPRAMSYDEVAAALSLATGRRIAHIRIGVEALAKRHRDRGLPEATAQILAAMDAMIAGGVENRTTAAIQTMTGKRPIDFEDFCARCSAVWNVTQAAQDATNVSQKLA